MRYSRPSPGAQMIAQRRVIFIEQTRRQKDSKYITPRQLCGRPLTKAKRETKTRTPRGMQSPETSGRSVSQFCSQPQSYQSAQERAMKSIARSRSE